MSKVTNPELLAQLNSTTSQKVTNPDILAQLNGEQSQAQPMGKWDAIKQGFGIVKDAVQGDAEFQEAGDWGDYMKAREGFLDMPTDFAAATAIDNASKFGNEDDVVNAINKYFPDAQYGKDESGNTVLIHEGQPFYLNKPGLDIQDVSSAANQTGAYIAGGAPAQAIKGTGLRMLATGTSEAAVNAALQKQAGRDEIDKKEVGLTGALGVAAEGLAPLVSKAWRWAKNTAKNNLEAGQAIAQVKNLDMNPKQLEKLGDMARNLDPDQVDIDTIIQHVELNQTPTRGTLTKDQYLLDAENKMRNSGRKSVQAKFDQLDDANQTGLAESIKDMGGVKATDDFDAADTILNNLKNSEAQARQGVNQAYDDVGQAFAKIDNIRDLPNTLKKELSNNSVILDPDNVPKTNVAMRDIEKSIEKMGDAKGVSWQAVDQQRKKLNRLFGGASPEDKRALTILKNKYDDVVHDAFERDLLSGDKDTIAKVQKARGLAADYFDKFQKGDKYDQAGGLIDKWLNADISPDTLADGIINVHGNFNQKSEAMIKRLVKIAGDDSQQVQAVRDLVLQRMTRKLGETKTREALRSSLRKSLKGKPTIFDTLFSKKEIGFLSRGLQYLDSTTLKGVKGRSSGTMERLNRWANMSVGDDVSMNSVLNTFKKAVGILTGGESRALRAPMRQLSNNPTAGAVVATQSQTNGQ